MSDLTASGDWMNRYRAGAATADEQRLLVEYVESLEAWKASAATVLAEWDETWKAAGEPGPLGASKAENVRRRIKDLREALTAITGVSPDNGTPRLDITDWANALYRAQRIAEETLADTEEAKSDG